MRKGGFRLENADSLHCYDRWDAPDCIISDGPYGLGLYPGEPSSVDKLDEAYRPHVEAWSRHAKPCTTLWFWNSEVGWATVHPLLIQHGWQYETCIIWNKGIAHIAGNVNGQSIRRFPVTTEICVFYSRKPILRSEPGECLPMKVWLRREWIRSGLPLYKSNDACGVGNAATRKYLTQDNLWYFPPGDMVVKMAAYASEHGNPTDRPYFSIDGTPITASAWESLRYKWTHVHGLSNVWDEPALRNDERIRSAGQALHVNQKPLSLMRRIINACTSEGDVVWEPFGGLCSASVAAVESNRVAFSAEIIQKYYMAALDRLTSTRATMGHS